MERETVLSGIVGSVAYGLANEQSDVDRLGVFVEPTDVLAGWDKPEETYHRVTETEDITLHEIGKFMKLAVKCNPTILELLFLPEELLEVKGYVGGVLQRAARDKFLSQSAVRNAYLGYATQQFRKLQARGDSFSSDTKNRTLKHARHLIRLLECGLDLYREGTMSVRVKDPDNLHWLAEQFVNTPSLAADYIAVMESEFESATSPLAEKPDLDWAKQYLLTIRRVMC